MTRWKSDFPVGRDEDSYVTRREFSKFLGLTSLAFVAGTLAATIRKWFGRGADAAAPHSVARVDEIPVGGYKLFKDPATNDPCILLRLDEGRFSAFKQECTHLSCPVYFNSAAKQLVCPCHHGYFSAEDGRPLAGPPKRPLDRLSVAIENASVLVAHSTSQHT